MKTKIIYISGSEVFDIADIRNAFEEVRSTLNLDKTTVLFGVPVDMDDCGIMNKTNENKETKCAFVPQETIENAETPEQNDDETIDTNVISEIPVVEEIVPTTKRGRPRKEILAEPDNATEESENVDIVDNTQETSSEPIPILSVLSTNQPQNESVVEETDIAEIEIIPEIKDEESEEIIFEQTNDQEETDTEQSDIQDETEEPDLEKLLSSMTPLEDDTIKEITDSESITMPETIEDDISEDATLEQLASEFAENQDKIASETKSTTRSKIGKLRNILPFKQSKRKDIDTGDLFGWAGTAANDEDFSVPGFFTNIASKK